MLSTVISLIGQKALEGELFIGVLGKVPEEE